MGAYNAANSVNSSLVVFNNGPTPRSPTLKSATFSADAHPERSTMLSTPSSLRDKSNKSATNPAAARQPPLMIIPSADIQSSHPMPANGSHPRVALENGPTLWSGD